RIVHYSDASLRAVAPDTACRKAAIELLQLTLETDGPVELPLILDRLSVGMAEAEGLIARLHALEMIDSGSGSIKGTTDGVLADYIRTRHRRMAQPMRRPLAGSELLGEKLKSSYELMMTRYNRAIESQLVELLSRFDFQSAPASAFDPAIFDAAYRGQGMVQVRRLQEDEAERVRLPQIVLVNDLGSGQRPGLSWRMFA